MSSKIKQYRVMVDDFALDSVVVDEIDTVTGVIECVDSVKIRKDIGEWMRVPKKVAGIILESSAEIMEKHGKRRRTYDLADPSPKWRRFWTGIIGVCNVDVWK